MAESGTPGRREAFAIVILALALMKWDGARAQVVSAPVQVSALPTPENEPDVAVAGDRAVAVWFRGAGMGWATSTDHGQTWRQDTSLLPVPPKEFTFSRPSVCATADGTFYCSTLIAREGGASFSIYRGTFEGGEVSWQGPTYAIPVISYGNPFPDSPQLRCDPLRGHLYLVYAEARREPGFRFHDYTIRFVRSLDGGVTWSEPLALSSLDSNGSRVAVGPDGEIYVIWEDFATRQVLGRKSADFGATFGPAFVVAAMEDNLGMRPPGWDTNPSHHHENPVYEHAGCLGVAFPSIAVDGSDGPRRGAVYVTWAERAAGTIVTASSTVFEQEPNGFYANATPFAVGQEIVGSQSNTTTDCDWFTFEVPAGMTVSLLGYPQDDLGFNFLVYCGTDTTDAWRIACGDYFAGSPTAPMMFTAPVTKRYYIYMPCLDRGELAYRIRIEQLIPDPASAARDQRDVVLVSSDDGGATWSPKVRVNDDEPLYENSLPSVLVDDAGRVHVAWYDRRDGLECAKLVHTYWSQSEDGGATFVPSRRLSTFAQDLSEIDEFDRSWLVGDHLALANLGTRVGVFWTQIPENSGVERVADIWSATIAPDSVPTPVLVSRFEAQAGDETIGLRWTVPDPARVRGFWIYRSGPDREPVSIHDRMIDAGPRSEHAFTDREVAAGVSYAYYLDLVMHGGERIRHGPIHVTLGARPGGLRWQGSTPNPSTGEAELTLAITRRQYVEVRIYDLTGALLQRLHSGIAEPGLLSLRWDGATLKGRRAAPGVYVVSAHSGGERVTRRIVRLR